MSSTKKVTAEPLTDAEIDHLLANLTSEEIEKLLEDAFKRSSTIYVQPLEALEESLQLEQASLKINLGH